MRVITLNKRQADRLRELVGANERRFATNRHPNCSKASNEYLKNLGLIELRGGRVAKSGRAVWHGELYATEAGRTWVAQNPI